MRSFQQEEYNKRSFQEEYNDWTNKYVNWTTTKDLPIKGWEGFLDIIDSTTPEDIYIFKEDLALLVDRLTITPEGICIFHEDLALLIQRHGLLALEVALGQIKREETTTKTRKRYTTVSKGALRVINDVLDLINNC